MAAEPGDASARLGGVWGLWGAQGLGGSGDCGVDAAHPGLGLGLVFMSSLGLGGAGKGEGGAGGAGGFPQRGLNVLKYSAYKRGQEFPAQTAREEETARPSCRPWHSPPGISAPGFLMPKKFRLLAKEGSGKFYPRPTRSRSPARAGGPVPGGCWVPARWVPRDTNHPITPARGVPAGPGGR